MPRLHVLRSIEIDAPPERVFEVVADYTTWSEWSPWLCAEPEARVDVSDNSSTVGATYDWEGQLVGAGRLTHLHLEPGRRIEDQIEFFRPFRSKSAVQFRLAPVQDRTVVSWRMDGSLPWFLFWMRSRMESFIAMDYDRGLKMLKQWIETGQVLSKTVVHDLEPIGPLYVAGVGHSCPLSDIGPLMDDAVAAATTLLSEWGLPSDGPPVAVYHNFQARAEAVEFTAGRLLPNDVGSVPPTLATWSIPRMKALRVEHIGAYQNLGNAWYTAMQLARHQKLKQSQVGPFEIYRNEPQDTSEAELRTDIYVPLK